MKARTIVNCCLVGAVVLALDMRPVAGEPPDALIAAVQKAATELAAADKAVSDTASALAQARKDLADKTAFAAAAVKKAAAAKVKADIAGAQDKASALEEASKAKAAADKATAERVAAEKLFTARQAALRAVQAKQAVARNAHQRAFRQQQHKVVADAQAAVIKAEDERDAMIKSLPQKLAAVKTATEAVAKAKAQATTAAKEAADAGALSATVSSGARAAALKTAKEKAVAAKVATEKAATAQSTLETAIAEKTSAEQSLARVEQALGAALSRAAAAKAVAFGGLTPLSDSAWDYAKARHLLYRAGFGGTPEEVACLHAMGLHRAVDYLVHFRKIGPPDIPFTAQPPERPAPFESQLAASEQNKLTQRRQQIEAQQLQGIRNWWLKRMVESPRPLEEKLTLFWHGHFASEYQTVEHSYFMFGQNQMFREHAAGNFGALLHGLVHDPTMLRYLNNDTNVKGHPNENLAREIMELFAMGVDQGYTEQDIREAARALTGYTFDHWSGQFRYFDNRHDSGQKTIFGKTGPWTGDDLVVLLLQQPHTARFIAKKLFTFFAYENPDPSTIERLAAVLRANNYELAPTLENLFTSEEFYSVRALGTQIKSPVQLTVGALRELGIKDVNHTYLNFSLRNMGQELLQPPNVKGWDGGRTWINANRIFIRGNAMADLLEGGGPRSRQPLGHDFVSTFLAKRQFQGPADVVDYVCQCCLAVPLSPAKRQALIDFLGGLPPSGEWEARRPEVNARLTALLVMLISSPEYQMT